MRYVEKPRIEHKEGEKRVKYSFLLFPKRLMNHDGLYETRWLEEAGWNQFYSHRIFLRLNVWIDLGWYSS